MDREEYFLGEEAHLSIKVRNPTNEVLLIKEPFGAGYVTVQKRTPEGYWTDIRPDEGHPEPTVSTIPISPGQELVRGFPSEPDCPYGEATDREIAVPDGNVVVVKGNLFAFCKLPDFPGEYRLNFVYSGAASVEFRIVAPSIVLWRSAKLAHPLIMHHTSPEGNDVRSPTLHARYLSLAVLQHGDRFTLIASRYGQHQPISEIIMRNLRAGAPITRAGAHQFAPFVRLAESDAEIVNVEVTADEQERATVLNRTRAGEARTILLDEHRQLIDP
jgi:hypothetical protein